MPRANKTISTHDKGEVILQPDTTTGEKQAGARTKRVPAPQQGTTR